MEQNKNETKIEYVHVELPNISFDEKGVSWRQQGYELIGVLSNGVKFGTKIDKDLRMVGIDENNKPVFKRINK